MTNNDLSQIGKLLDEKLTAIEKRLRTEIAATKDSLRTEIAEKSDEVVNVLLEFMQAHLIPLIAESADKSDVERIERRIDHLADKVSEHDVRLKNIESIPAIAHQLKIKKAK